MRRRTQIPIPVVRRLVKYLALLQRLKESDQEWVSSRKLGQALSLTAATVRRDFTHLDFSGRKARGYEVASLEKALSDVLGLGRRNNAVVVGAGNLGRALAQHGGFAESGFRVRAILDSDPRLFGKRVGRLVVQSVDDLPEVVQKERTEIGIIAVPARAAQTAADQLTAAGIRGLLNFACAHVSAPQDVAIIDARLVESLQALSCAIREASGAG